MNPHATDNPLRILKEELGSTVQQVQLDVESYLENPLQTAPLASVVEGIQRMEVAFTRWQCPDAVALSREIITLARGLADGQWQDQELAHDALLRAVLQLSSYLDWLRRENQQQPFDLITVLDQLRAVRGLEPSGLGKAKPPAFLTTPGPQAETVDLNELVAQLRPDLQQALFKVLRDKDIEDSLQEIAGIFAQFKNAAADERTYRFWWLAEALVVELLDGSLTLDREICLLLRDVDAQLKHLVDTGQLFASHDVARVFSQRIITHLSQSDSGAERLRERTGYSPPLPVQNELTGTSRSMFRATGPDLETLLRITDLLKESMALVSTTVEAVATEGEQRLNEFEEQLERLHEVANVLIMLNMDVPASLIQGHIRLFRQWLTDGGGISADQLMQLAGELILVEYSLESVGKPAFRQQLAALPDNDLDAADGVALLMAFQREWAEMVVNQELIKLLGQIRQTVTTPDHHETLATWRIIQSTLYDIGHVLTLIDQTQEAGLINRLKKVAQALATEQVEEKPLVMDTFAEAVTTVEYSLDLASDGQQPDSDVLAYAERQVNLLEGLIGIPMAEVEAEGVAPADKIVIEPVAVAAADLPVKQPPVAAKPPAPAAAPVLSVTLPDPSAASAATADPEILEIFFEEAQGELSSIRDNLQAWRQNLKDKESLTTIRRSFHTLKGSGRMVEQFTVGEFAWCYEQLLNRVLGDELAPSLPIIDAVDAAQAALRPLVGDAPTTGDEFAVLTALVDRAQVLARGEAAPAAVPIPAETETIDVTLLEAIEPPPIAPEEIAEPFTEETLETTAEAVPAVPEPIAPEEIAEPFTEEALETAAKEVPAVPEPIAPPVRRLPAGVDPDLVEIFEQEAAEILDTGAALLTRWRTERSNTELLSELCRGMHTLKGSSRMAGFPLIGDLAQAAESVLQGLSTNKLQDTATLTTALQRSLDRLSSMMVAVRNDIAVTPADDLINTLRQLMEAVPAAVPTPPPAEATTAWFEPPRPLSPVAAEPVGADQQLTELDQELVAAFKYEAAEILDSSDVNLQRWSAEQGNVELLSELRRDMHTLKGSSRMTGFMTIGDLAHATESLLDALGKGNLKPSSAVVDAMQQALDGLDGMVEQIRNGATPEPAENLINSLRALLGETAREERVKPVQAVPQPAAPVVDKAAANEDTVRVSAALLNTLVNEMGESSIYRSRIDQGVGALRFNLSELEQTVYRLRQQLRRLEIETEAQILFRYEEGKDTHEDFDPLELDRFSELQQLSRSLMESIDDLANIQTALEDQTQEIGFLLDQQAKVNKEVQQSLMRTRMVRFSSIAPRLRRVVRQSAQELGKRAELAFEGSEAEVDRTILDNMVAPLEHMLRNSMSHGVEAPEDRLAAGKPEAGTIILSIRREGAELVLNLKDDGAGLDYQAIRNKGENMGLLIPGQAVTEDDLIALLLRPGFSTAKKVTQISGRGVGMDVLNDAIKAMRGALFIQSERGQGTSFTIRLPFSLAVTQALLIKAGTDTYAIPLLSIESVARLDESVYKAYRAGLNAEHKYGSYRYPVHSLGILLGVDTTVAEEEETDKRPPVLLFRNAEASAALKVDAILGNQEVIVKPVGPQFQAVIGISGATVLGDGRVVVVLELAALVRALTTQSKKQAEARALYVARQEEGRREHIRALVVDDSITMRKVTARFLERHNIKVNTAKDGLDALPKLEAEIPDLVILDIEMPRMDGFELAAHIRNQAHLRHIPIIIVTSRGGEKHRERATKLGVNDYLTKPYQEEQMLASIRRILGTSDLDMPLPMPATDPMR